MKSKNKNMFLAIMVLFNNYLTFNFWKLNLKGFDTTFYIFFSLKKQNNRILKRGELRPFEMRVADHI